MVITKFNFGEHTTGVMMVTVELQLTGIFLMFNIDIEQLDIHACRYCVGMKSK